MNKNISSYLLLTLITTSTINSMKSPLDCFSWENFAIVKKLQYALTIDEELPIEVNRLIAEKLLALQNKKNLHFVLSEIINLSYVKNKSDNYNRTKKIFSHDKKYYYVKASF